MTEQRTSLLKEAEQVARQGDIRRARDLMVAALALLLDMQNATAEQTQRWAEDRVLVDICGTPVTAVQLRWLNTYGKDPEIYVEGLDDEHEEQSYDNPVVSAGLPDIEWMYVESPNGSYVQWVPAGFSPWGKVDACRPVRTLRGLPTPDCDSGPKPW